MPSTTSSPRTAQRPKYRDVTIVDTSQKKKLELQIEVPVEDMARIGELGRDPERAGVAGAGAVVDLDAPSTRGCSSSCRRIDRR